MQPYHWPTRTQPYTALGITRLPCCHCGARAGAQARCCADGSYRPYCLECHNRFVDELLAFLGLPDDPPGRVKPYADYGVYRAPCVRCGARSRYQWRLGQAYRTVCPDCDLALNDLTLHHLRHPHAAGLLAAYRERIEDERHDVPAAALRRTAA